MDLEDMTNLVIAHDAANEIEYAVKVIGGPGCGDGALEELSYMSNLILKYSPMYKKCGPDHDLFWDLLNDDSLSTAERAKKLLEPH